MTLPINDTDRYTITTGAIRQIKSNVDSAISELPSSEDIDSLSLAASYDDTNKRLVFDNITFDSIYPSVGKYGLATFPEDTATTATAFDGDREWLLDWRPYLVDMTTVTGEVRKTPVAELKKNNWLRKIDGSYAPAVGITSTQSTACNVELYWDSAHTKAIRSDIAAAYSGSTTTFQPDKFWEYVNSATGLAMANTRSGSTYSYAIEVVLYNASGTAFKYGNYNNNHIVAPWETTEIKYSVFIGREKDCYLVDGYSATTGEHMRGLMAKPVSVGSGSVGSGPFDPEEYKLARTGIAPGPCTTKSNKVRAFFYNYYDSSETNTAGGAGSLSVLVNNGHYPRYNVNQYDNTTFARNNNGTGTTAPAYPVGEGGYHAYNAFLCSIEAAYSTRAVFTADGFSSGNSSNDGCTSAATMRTNGGFSVKVGTGSLTYLTFVQNAKSAIGASSDAYVYNVVNGQYPHFQCMEPQIAASLAVEMNVAANADFSWNGGTWHYELPTRFTVKAPLEGAMNCRIYKEVSYSGKTIASIANCSGSFVLRCALAEGVNPVGDIWWFLGGGAELVYHTNGTSNTSYDYSFYLEPDQTKWYNYGSKADSKEYSGSNTKFPTESMYKKILDSRTDGGRGNDYCLARYGYTPVRRIAGGAKDSGECTYQYRTIGEYTPADGQRSRRRLLFRGGAGVGNCSPRYLHANYRPSNSSVLFGCTAQVLLA